MSGTRGAGSSGIYVVPKAADSGGGSSRHEGNLSHAGVSKRPRMVDLQRTTQTLGSIGEAVQSLERSLSLQLSQFNQIVSENERLRSEIESKTKELSEKSEFGAQLEGEIGRLKELVLRQRDRERKLEAKLRDSRQSAAALLQMQERLFQKEEREREALERMELAVRAKEDLEKGLVEVFHSATETETKLKAESVENRERIGRLESELKALRERYSKELERKAEIHASREAELRASYEAELQALKRAEASARERAAAMEEESKRNASVSRVKEREAQWKELEALALERRRERDEIQSRFSSQMEALRSKLEEQKFFHASAIQALEHRHASEIEFLNAKHAASAKSAERELEREFEREALRVREAHEAALRALEEKLSASQESLSASRESLAASKESLKRAEGALSLSRKQVEALELRIRSMGVDPLKDLLKLKTLEVEQAKERLTKAKQLPFSEQLALGQAFENLMEQKKALEKVYAERAK